MASTLEHDDVTSFTCAVNLRSSLSQVPNNLNSSTLSINCLIFQGERWSVSVKIIHFRHLLGGNNHLLTNNKLCKIGCVQEDKCSLCKTDSESLYLIVFERRHTKQFWKEFQYYFATLTREFVCLSLQRLYYRNIIYKFSFAELFDTDR